MTVQSVKYSLGILLLAVLVCSCGTQRIAVRQRISYVDRYTVGPFTVRHFRAYDFSKLDSNDEILLREYIPYDGYIVSDARDSVKFYVLASWTEYLSRFAERMSLLDKQYYTPVYRSTVVENGKSYIIWEYPSIKDLGRDIRLSDKIRNEYWTVDVYQRNGSFDQKYESFVRSFPQATSFEFRQRFTAGGSYSRAMIDTAEAFGSLRKQLDSLLGGGRK